MVLEPNVKIRIVDESSFPWREDFPDNVVFPAEKYKVENEDRHLYGVSMEDIGDWLPSDYNDPKGEHNYAVFLPEQVVEA